MTYLSMSLSQIVERHGTQVAFARMLDIDPTLLSRYMRGTVKPSDDVISRIAEHLDESDRIELVMSYLMDIIPPSARELIRIEPNPTRVQESADIIPSLPRELMEAHLFLMRRSVDTPEVADHILTTARLLRGR